MVFGMTPVVCSLWREGQVYKIGALICTETLFEWVLCMWPVIEPPG